MTDKLDPITFEILRHKLWAINYEAAFALRLISGSPVANEANDMNTALLTPEGETLVACTYILSGAIAQGLIVKYIVEQYKENPGICEEDMFLANDPYTGSVHQNCVSLVGPIHWQGEVIAWAGATIHLIDVGGATPGQAALEAKSIYEEAPVIPPIRIVEAGRLRKDIENEYLIRSRTRALNALDLRAKMASINVAKGRIKELIQRYGVETIKAAMAAIIEHSEEKLRSRLREIPDGTWCHTSFIDFHEGSKFNVYPIRLAMTKKGDSLLFDFTGSAKQAPAVVNSTYSGLLSGVVIGVLTCLCFDIPWSPAAATRVIKIIAEQGTIVNATWPAGVSRATTAAGQQVTTASNVCLAKMLAASDKYREHLMASWMGACGAQDVFGIDRRGKMFGGVIVESMVGGGGARTYKDGIDTGGHVRSLSGAVANVETTEFRYPFLYLYRRQQMDSGGPGKFRGGVGLSSMVVPHGVERISRNIMHWGGCAQPESAGISGGYPASTNQPVIKRGSNIEAFFSNGKIPSELDEIDGQLEVIPGVRVSDLKRGDVYRVVISGGGGYADPLDRDPKMVLNDVVNGLVSLECAKNLYGVVVNQETKQIEPELMEEQRKLVMQGRRKEIDVSEVPRRTPEWDLIALEAKEAEAELRINEYLEVISSSGKKFLRCKKCFMVFCYSTENYKEFVASRTVPLSKAGPHVCPYSFDVEFALREFYCPGCLTMLHVEVVYENAAIERDTMVLL